MASITTRRRSDGSTTWRVGYYASGKLCWTPSIYTAEGAVEIKELIESRGHEVALAVLSKRRKAAGDSMLLRDVLDRYLSSLGAHAARGTAAEYRRTAARTWLPDLGPLPVEAIDRESIEAWVARQRTTETDRSAKRRARITQWNREHPRDKQPVPDPQTYSPKSIKNAHTILSQTLAYAADTLELITRNPAKGARLPKDDQAREKDIFTREEFARFIAAMQPTYKALTAFLVVSGCRINEATALQVRDLDITSPPYVVNVRRAYKRGETAGDGSRYLGSPKSRRSIRPIVIPQPLAHMLADLTQGRAAEDHVFQAEQGGPVRSQNYSQRQFPTALRRAGITKHLTPHSLRHTSASWLLMDGVSPIVVQHRLGHESLDTTSKVYSHLLQDAQLPAAALMEHILPTRPNHPQLDA